MPSPPHRFFGCNCKYSCMSPWATFHFYVAPLQEIELECDKKFHLSNGKVLIMAEASSLAEFFLHRNVTYKLLQQNCKTNLCGNACATENIVLKFTLFVKVSLIGCINLHGSKQKYHCSRWRQEVKSSFRLIEIIESPR